MGGRRIKVDLSDFVESIGCHRWMFLSDDKFATVGDLVEQLREEYSQLKKNTMVEVFMGGEFVIPHLEPIQILQSGDLVRVVHDQRKRERRIKLKDKLETGTKLCKKFKNVSRQNKILDNRIGTLHTTDIHVRKSNSARHGIDERKSESECQVLVKKCNKVQGVNASGGLFTQKPITLNSNVSSPNSDVPNSSLSHSVFNPCTGQVDVYTNKSVVVQNKDYFTYPAVGDTEPRVEDIIAFKVVELGEDYAPRVSEYKEGKVLEVDDEEVKFNLVNNGYKRKNGKFEIDDIHGEETVTYKLMQLIDAKLLSI